MDARNNQRMRKFHDETWEAMATDLPSLIDDPERWRKRAAEMRRVADDMASVPLVRASVLKTAEEYDRLARRVEERLKGGVDKLNPARR
jgi:hypothetical protein